MTGLKTFSVLLITAAFVLVSIPMFVMVDERDLQTTTSANNVPTTRYTTDCDMVILTPNAFTDEYQVLADFRNSTGVHTRVVSTEDVLADNIFTLTGDSNMEKYKWFIKECLDNWNITYFLLGGDTGQIPTCGARVFSDFPSVFYTDLYYADVYINGNTFADWDTNEDDKFGTYTDDRSSLDLDPEVTIGRLPSDSETEAQDMVAKIINYENTAVGEDWFKNATFLVGPDMATGETFSDYMANNYYKASDGWNVNKLYDQDSTQPKFLDPKNHSVGIMSFWGHGGETAWLGEDYINVSEVNQMTNAGKLPIVTMMACNCGNLGHSSDCLAESFLKKQTGGAVTVLAGSQTSNGADKDDKSGAVVNFYHESYALDGAKTTGEMYDGMIAHYLNRESPLTDSLEYKNLVEYIHFSDPATNVGGYSVTTAKISVADNDLYAKPGDFMTFNVSVENLGTGYADLVITASQPDDTPVPVDWVLNFNTGSTLDIGQNLTIPVTVTSPDLAAGSFQDIKLSVFSSNFIGEKYLNITFRANVLQNPEFEFEATPTSKSVNLGEWVQYSLRITNTGNDQFDFNLNVIEQPECWTIKPLTDKNLNPSETSNSLLEIFPDQNSTAGQYFTKIECHIPGFEEENRTVTVATIINESNAFEIKAVQSILNISQGDTAVFNVSITNLGNHNDTITLNIPTKKDWKFTYDDTHVLGPFQTKYVEISAKSPTKALAGDYNIPVTATLDSDASQIEFNLTTRIEALHNFKITTAENTSVVVSNENSEFTINIENLGNIGEVFHLNTSECPDDCSVNSLGKVIVDPYSVGKDTFYVRINDTFARGGIKRVNITIRSEATGETKFLIFEITKEIYKDVSLFLETNPAVLDPQEINPIWFSVSNLGNVVDTYDISLKNLGGWTLEPKTHRVTLDKFSNTTVCFNITVPLGQPAGSVSCDVCGVSIIDPSIKDSTSISLKVDYLYDFDIKMLNSSRNVLPGGSLDIEFDVTNLGNAKDTISTEIFEFPEGWTITENIATLDPDESSKGTIQITPPENAEPGEVELIFSTINLGKTKYINKTVTITVLENRDPVIPDDDDDDDSSMVLAAVAIPIVLVIVLIIIIVVVIVLMRSRKKEPESHPGPAIPPEEPQPGPAEPAQAPPAGQTPMASQPHPGPEQHAQQLAPEQPAQLMVDTQQPLLDGSRSLSGDQPVMHEEPVDGSMENMDPLQETQPELEEMPMDELEQDLLAEAELEQME